MTDPNTNPDLISGFCTSGTKEDIPNVLKVTGWTPENPNINGNQYNKIFNEIFGYLNFLKSKGLSFWQNDKAYYATANNIDIVRKNNKIYFAKQNSNTDPENNPLPKDPATNSDFWGVLLDLDKPIYTELAKYALKNGSNQNLFKVKNAIADDEAVSKNQMETALASVETSVNVFEKPNGNETPLFIKTNANSFKIPAGLIVKVGSVVVSREADITISLNTHLDSGAKTAGTDYYIYAKQDGTFTISANATAPAGYTILTTRKIGGFHYGLIPESFTTINNITSNDATAIAGINAFSFWDLKFRPICSPEGMVCVGGFWVDIYLCNSEHIVNGTSKASGYIAGGALTYSRQYPKIPLSKGGNGATNYGSMTWFEASEIGSANDKRLLSYGEFQHIAFGVKEASSASTLDTGLIKHIPDYVSKFGVEQATGVQWIWGSDLHMRPDGSGWAWKANTEGRGSLYSYQYGPTAVVLGGDRDSGSDAGSRASSWSHYVWASFWYVGVRFACDHLKLV